MALLTRVLIVVLAVVVFLIGMFAVDQAPIALQFLGWHTQERSAFWWLLLAFGLGAVAGVVGAGIGALRRVLELRRVQRELKRTQQEVHQLRSATLHD